MPVNAKTFSVFIAPPRTKAPEGAGSPWPPKQLLLSDGGVYDNLGLQPLEGGCSTILVSDSGGQMGYETGVPRDWGRQMLRVTSVIDNQVRNLRKRGVVSAYQRGELKGAYWGIRTDIGAYQLADALPVDFAVSTEIAGTKTRLAAMGDPLQERLINWGYAVVRRGHAALGGRRRPETCAVAVPSTTAHPRQSLAHVRHDAELVRESTGALQSPRIGRGAPASARLTRDELRSTE